MSHFRPEYDPAQLDPDDPCESDGCPPEELDLITMCKNEVRL